MKTLLRVLIVLLGSVIAPLLFAQSTLTGTVRNTAGQPLGGVEVRIADLRRVSITTPEGQFTFNDVPAGRHVVQVVSPRFGNGVRELTTSGSPATLEFVLDVGAVHEEEITVTASVDPRAASEVYQPVDVIAGEDLQSKQRATLGETLAEQPGVNSTGFVPGSSRPVIRGLGGDRIRILEDGIGVGDASNVSQDHNVSIDPANAQSIEILRGPATLLYGSNAVGGVVNVIDDRIPVTKVQQAISGNVELRGGTVADERTGAISLDGGGGQFAWHGNFSKRDTGDIDTPIGELLNSDIDTKSGAIGASWVGSTAFLGLSYSGYDTNYGVSDAGPGVEPEEVVRIDMRQRRVDLKTEIAPTSGPFTRYRLRLGRTDYNHFEVPGGVPEVEFINDYSEGRLEASHRTLGPFNGSLGVQYSDRDFSVEGEEFLLPPTVTKNKAFFVFEEWTSSGPFRVQAGARYEQQDVEVDSDEVPDRDFDGLSGSLGLIWAAPATDYSIALTGSHSARLPVAEELYFNGAHEATFQFEIGDPNLDVEKGNGIDLALRKKGERFSGEVSVFATNFDGYIYQQPTGEEEDGFAVFQFSQADATFRGAEAHLDFGLLHSEPHHLALELSGDYVRAKLKSTDGSLPFIPPSRYGVGLRYQGSAISGMVEARRTSKQDRVASFETETDGYTLVNASLGYRLFVGNSIHDILLRGNNLTDELARNHLNPLKDVVPLPGRDFSLSYRVTF